MNYIGSNTLGVYERKSPNEMIRASDIWYCKIMTKAVVKSVPVFDLH